jgi:hypothetical protein
MRNDIKKKYFSEEATSAGAQHSIAVNAEYFLLHN